MIIPVRIRHSEPLDQVRWHAQLEIAAKGDPDFVSPLVVRDSHANQTNWFARVDEHGVDGVLQLVPADGVLTTKSASFEQQESAAVMFAVLTEAEVEALGGATEVWLRARQSATLGMSWGDWSTEPKLVPIEPAADVWSAEQRDQLLVDLTAMTNDLNALTGAVDAGFAAVDQRLDGIEDDVSAVGDAVTNISGKVTAVSDQIGDLDGKVDDLGEDVAGVGEGVSTGVAALDAKLDATNAEIASLKVKLAASATLAELTLRANQHLTLRQGAAYLASIGTALKVVLEGVSEETLNEGTAAHLRLRPRPGYRGAAHSFQGTLADAGEGKVAAIFEIGSTQTASMAPSFRGHIWEVALHLGGNANAVVMPVAGLATVEQQAG